MKIKLMHLDPKVTELIESNNQQENRIDILSDQVTKLYVELQKLNDHNEKQRMEKLNQY